MKTPNTTLPLRVAAGLALGCLASGARAQVDTARVSAIDARSITDYLTRVRQATGVPGISAAVAWHGNVVFSGGAGYADLDNLVAQTGSTVHNIGSVSKTQAVVAVMQLFEQGKIRLDTLVQAYVPFFPIKPWPITVRQILTHTSGIRHYADGDFGADGFQEARHYDSYEESTRFWRDDSLRFRPGTYWSYSSYATGLMQGIVEKVSGMKFEDYLTRYVWEPAGMLGAGLDLPSRIFHNRGRGYERDPRGRLVNARYADVSYKYASGGVVASVEDLVRFGAALNHGLLLRRATLDSMYRIQVKGLQAYGRGKPQPMPFEQALVWYIQTDGRDRRFIGHGGSVKGTRTMLLNYPELDLVVALTANGEPFDAQSSAQAVAQLVLSTMNLGERH